METQETNKDPSQILFEEEEKKEELPKIKDDICERCNAKNSLVLDVPNGELVCTNCGLVAQDRIIDDTYEKRNFGSENGGNKSESRISGPMKAGEGYNLGSSLVKMDKDGNAIKAKSGGSSYNQSPIERNYQEINNILGNKDIKGTIIEETKMIYSQVIKELRMKGRNFKAMICAMYFIASRNQKVSKSFKDIAAMFNVPEAKIKKAYNHIKKVVVNVLTVEQQNDTLETYIRDFCNNNKERYEYKNLAIKIAKNINEKGFLEGKNTKTIAGLSLFIAKKKEKTLYINKNDICKEFGNVTTIDNAYNKVEDYFDKIIPDNYQKDLEKLKEK